MMPDLFLQSRASFETAPLEVEEATVLAVLCCSANVCQGQADLQPGQNKSSLFIFSFRVEK